MKKVYIERYVLGVFVALVGGVVLGNPLAWDSAQRISSFVAISAAALLTAILLENKKHRRSFKLRNVRNCCITALLISIIWFGFDSMKQNSTGIDKSKNAPASTVKQETHGQNSPAVANVNGDVNINGKSERLQRVKDPKK